jgi:hypothetical protein
MRTKLIATTVAAIAVSGGAAAAATGTLPTQSETGRATAEEHTGFEVPTDADAHPTADDHPGGRPAEAPGDEVLEVEAPAPDAAGADTHGAEVSAVAQGDTTGREHGEAVSSVASENGAAHAADPAAEAATPGTVPDAASDRGAEGAANAAGRGRP